MAGRKYPTPRQVDVAVGTALSYVKNWTKTTTSAMSAKNFCGLLNTYPLPTEHNVLGNYNWASFSSAEDAFNLFWLVSHKTWFILHLVISFCDRKWKLCLLFEQSKYIMIYTTRKKQVMPLIFHPYDVLEIKPCNIYELLQLACYLKKQCKITQVFYWWISFTFPN